MTLVVARKSGNQLAIVSDTKLSDYQDALRLKQNPKDGAIKSVIINDNLCVCFSGKIDFAFEALKSIQNDASLNDAIPILLEFHQKSKWDTSFIACEGYPIPKIVFIETGECEETENAWIGDKKAYELFQQYNLKGDSQSGNFFSLSYSLHNSENQPKSLESLYKSLNSVIGSSLAPTVKGFCIQVRYANKFFYAPTIDSSIVSNAIILKTGPNIVPITHASPEIGGYTFNFIGADKSNSALAIHLKQGSIGVLYIKKDNIFKPTIHLANEKDFYDLIQEYGIICPIRTE